MNEFENIIQALWKTQNNDFNNKFEQEKIERFKILCKNKKLIFFGLGYYGKKMEKYLKLKYGVDVYGYYDWIEETKTGKGAFAKSNDLLSIKKEKYYKGKDKLNLISYDEFYADPENTVIFINMPIFLACPYGFFYSGFKYFYTIRNLAKDVISADMINKMTTNLQEYDLNELNHSYSQAEIAKIITLYNILKDEKSKQVFMNILKFKLTEDYYYTLEVKDDVTLQYLDPKVISFSEEEVFIDCGGFTGDTIEAFAKTVNKKFKHIYTYEPEEKNLKILKKNIKDLNYENITPINAGVSNESRTLYIKGNEGGATITNEETDEKIEVAAIDKTINHIPTFIKMDVQSFEIRALLGAKQNIQKHKPKCAICIYHKFVDLWEIPLLLKLWVPEYELIMRHYSPTQEETVIYAIPK